MPTLKELRKEAKKLGLKKYSKLKKKDLIALINSNTAQKIVYEPTLKELRKEAKSKGLKKYSKLKKKELIALINSNKAKIEICPTPSNSTFDVKFTKFLNNITKDPRIKKYYQKNKAEFEKEELFNSDSDINFNKFKPKPINKLMSNADLIKIIIKDPLIKKLIQYHKDSPIFEEFENNNDMLNYLVFFNMSTSAKKDMNERYKWLVDFIKRNYMNAPAYLLKGFDKKYKIKQKIRKEFIKFYSQAAYENAFDINYNNINKHFENKIDFLTELKEFYYNI